MKDFLVLMGLMLTVSGPLVSQSHADGHRINTEMARGQKTAHGQQSVSNTSLRDANKNLTDQQERALQVLDQLAEMTRSSKMDEWTIRVQARIADLLWNYDQEKARTHFAEIFDAIDSVFATTRQHKDSSASRMPARYLRSEVLGLISRHDPDMAETLIRTLETDPDTHSTSAAIEKERAFLSLQTGAALVDTDPSRAADLINSSLSSGLTAWFVATLQAIRHKNPALADDVLARALSMAQEDKEHSNKNMRLLAASVFPEATGGMIASFGGEDEGDVAVGFDLRSSPARPAAGPAVTKQFLNFVYRTFMQAQVPTEAAGAEAARGILHVVENSTTVHMLLPLFDQHFPDKSAMLRARLNEIGKSFNLGEGRSFDSFLDFFDLSAGPEEHLKQAQAQTDPAFRDILYQQAAQAAARSGEMDKVLSILEKVSDEGIKTSIRSAAAYQTVTNALDRNDLDAAYRELKNLSSPLEQARFLTQMAQKLLEQKDNGRAAQWLMEAEQLARKADARERVYQLLSTAEVIAQLDSDRGLSLMASIVDDINAESRKTAEVKAGPDAMMSDRGPDLLIANTLLENKIFPHLARADFELALSLAQSIVQKESSVAAQLGVCRGVLAQSNQRKVEEKGKKNRLR